MLRLGSVQKWSVLLSLCTIVVFALDNNYWFVNKIYAPAIYPVVAQSLRALSNVVSFSLGDVLYTLFIIYCLRGLFRFLKYLVKKQLTKKQLVDTPFRVINTVFIFYLLFQLTWGFNYSRQPVNKTLGIAYQPYNLQELKQLGSYFILKLAALKPDHSVFYSPVKLETEAVNAYNELAKRHPIFYYKNPGVKPALNSWLISKIGIEGYYNPFSGEANINTKLPQFILPFTVCHEIAHQIGIGREDEANLLAYLTAMNSDDVNFRYAAYYSMLTSILYELRYKSPDDFIRLYNLLPPQVLKDLETEKAFWKKYNNRLFGYMNTALDTYLKINDQQMGVDSYQNIVRWVYNFHKNEL